MSKEAMKLALEMLQNKMYAHAEMYLTEALAKQELLFEVDGEMLTLNQIAGVELFNFQEATGCDTAAEFKAKQEQTYQQAQRAQLPESPM
jgi:hypothetical protein